MGRRKKSNEEQEQELEEKIDGKEFYGCYLLTSLSPSHKGHTYIGFTVNPRRRIRQHNGEIGSGAVRTKKKRPWEMVLCIYGFPSNVSALQFEWAWQHPIESLAVRKAAVSFKSLGGLANKIKLAFTMLTLSKWQELDLTVNFFSSKYTKYSAGCPALPEQMRVQVSSMEDLPCYTGIYNTCEDDYEDDDINHLDNNDLSDEMGVKDTSGKEGFANTAVESEIYNCKSIEESQDTISYNGIDYLFNRNNDGGLFDSSVDDITRSEDLCYSVSAKENVIEIDHQPNEDMVAKTGVFSDEPAANNPIICQKAEIIDLLSPSPGYRVGFKSKRRRISSGVIDLTRSPIFVEV